MPKFTGAHFSRYGHVLYGEAYYNGKFVAPVATKAEAHRVIAAIRAGDYSAAASIRQGILKRPNEAPKLISVLGGFEWIQDEVLDGGILNAFQLPENFPHIVIVYDYGANWFKNSPIPDHSYEYNCALCGLPFYGPVLIMGSQTEIVTLSGHPDTWGRMTSLRDSEACAICQMLFGVAPTNMS